MRELPWKHNDRDWQWKLSHSESHRNMNACVWHSMQCFPCTTISTLEAWWFCMATDIFFLSCKEAFLCLVTSSLEWKNRIHDHVIWLWDGPDPSFGFGKSLESFDNDWNVWSIKSAFHTRESCAHPTKQHFITSAWMWQFLGPPTLQPHLVGALRNPHLL